MKNDKNLDRLLADVVLGHELEFTVGDHVFRLYPLTLAKMLLLRPHADALRLYEKMQLRNPYLGIRRIARKNREKCCHILAVLCTPNTRQDLHDRESVSRRREYLMENIGEKSLGTLMLYVLSADHTDELMTHLGLDRERERLGQVLDVKRKADRNSLNFGGVSLFGAFIGQLKEMGYTDSEVLYEYSYSYLRLMLADKITSVHVTDEELSELPADAGGTLLPADDPESADALMAFFAERGVNTQTTRENRVAH